MDAQSWLESYEHRVQRVTERAAEARAELEQITSTAQSPDGAVSVTVNPAGALQELSLAPPAEDLSRAQLAAAILDTARRAQGHAAQRVAATMAPLLGDTEAMDFLRSQIPPPPEETGRRPRASDDPDEGYGSVLRRSDW